MNALSPPILSADLPAYVADLAARVGQEAGKPASK